MLFKSIVSLSALVATASAFVWDAKIIKPDSNTVLTAGQSYTVTWETTMDGYKIPDEVLGMLVLGYMTEDPADEHLNWTLAENFPLHTGSFEVTIPEDLPTRHDYIIDLLGDSGNESQQFTIKTKKD